MGVSREAVKEVLGYLLILMGVGNVARRFEYLTNPKPDIYSKSGILIAASIPIALGVYLVYLGRWGVQNSSDAAEEGVGD